MANPFPQLFFLYPFFIPTFLRFVVSITLVHVTYRLVRERERIQRTPLPLVGRAPAWLVWTSACITLFVAFCLFVGYGTQWAAIATAIIALKQVLLPKRFGELRILSRDAACLLFFLSISLLFSGAGAFALDMPL